MDRAETFQKIKELLDNPKTTEKNLANLIAKGLRNQAPWIPT